MSNVVRLFEQASQEHEEERMTDQRERRRLACLITATVLGVILFGVLCFDIGMRVGAALAR